MYRLPLLPPSRLAAFLNTSEFSAREEPTWKVGISRADRGYFQVILGVKWERSFCLKGEGKVGLTSISEKRNLIHLRPAQTRCRRLICLNKSLFSRSIWAQSLYSIKGSMQIHIIGNVTLFVLFFSGCTQ